MVAPARLSLSGPDRVRLRPPSTDVLEPLDVWCEPPLSDDELPDDVLEDPPPTQAPTVPLAVFVFPALTDVNHQRTGRTGRPNARPCRRAVPSAVLRPEPRTGRRMTPHLGATGLRQCRVLLRAYAAAIG